MRWPTRTELCDRAAGVAIDRDRPLRRGRIQGDQLGRHNS